MKITWAAESNFVESPFRFVTLHTVPTVKILLDIVTPPIELDDAVGDANLDAWADPLTFRVYPSVFVCPAIVT